METVDEADSHQILTSKIDMNHGRAISRSILFENGSTLVELASGPEPRSRLVVTFAPPELCDINGFGYYEHLLTSASFDVLAIKQAANSGYADLTHETITGIYEALPQYESWTVLGADAGATAALRLFSRFVGCKILALSPNMAHECTLTRPSQASINIVYDPILPAEVENLRAASAVFSRAQVVRISHLGVPTRYSLEETGTLIRFISALAEGRDFDANRHFRKNRSASATALLVLGNSALKRRHFSAAKTLLKRSYAIDHRQEAGIAYCQALRENGQRDAAVEFMNTIVHREQGNAHLWAVKSYFEEMAGQREDALTSVRRAIQMLPDVEVFHIAERRLLNELYDDLRLKQKMTEAALDKTRAEFALIEGGNDASEFSLQRMWWFAGATALILAAVAATAIIFRLV